LDFGSGGSGGGGGAGRSWPDPEGKCWEEVVDDSGVLPVTKLVEVSCPPIFGEVTDLYAKVLQLDERVTSMAISIQNIPISFDNALAKYFYAYEAEAGSHGVHWQDGMFTVVIKKQVNRIVNAISALPFATKKDIDAQTTSLVNQLNKQPSYFDSFFRVVGNYEGSGEVHSLDGAFVKLIKGQFTRVVNAVNNLPVAKKIDIDAQTTSLVNQLNKQPSYFDSFFRVVGNYEGSGEVHSLDGAFVKLIKGQNTRVVNAIANIKFEFPAPVIKTFNDILASVQKLDKPEFKIPDSISKLLEDIEKAISNLDLVGGDAATNFWDFLGGLFGDIFELVEFLIEKVIYLVVPEDSSFITTSLNGLSDSLSNKFEPMNTLKNNITSSFQIEEKEFGNVAVSLPIYGTVEMFNSTFINMAIPKLRQLLSGIMVLVTAIWAYRKITTEMIK